MGHNQLTEIMATLYVKANQDSSFRKMLIDNPVEVIAQHGVEVCDPQRLMVEYNEGYGIFIGLPKPIRQASAEDNIPQATISTLNDCLHH